MTNKIKIFSLFLILLVDICLNKAISSTFSYKDLGLKLSPVNVDHLNATEKRNLSIFLSEVLEILPLKFKEVLDEEISLLFSKKLARKTQLGSPNCDSKKFYPHNFVNQTKADVLGQYIVGKGIFLNFNFLKKIVDKNSLTDGYGCDHGSYYKLAKATLIHELSHAFDLKKMKNIKKKDLTLKKCLKFKKKYFIYPTNACKQRAREDENAVSDLIQYRHLSGWADKGLLFPSSSLSHYIVKRSPLPYEYKNQTEHFPVNMEFFLLDPEYKCRRPALYRFFSHYFDHIPFPNFSCEVNTSLKLDNIIDRVMTKIDLKERKIHSIHYLYATEGAKFSEKMGTGMFRIVLCSSFYNPYPNDCVKNSDDDIVFSYKRTGKELVIVQAQSMMEIKYQYNEVEFRDLYSLPIKMEKYERELFFYQLLSDYWEFSGRYYLGGGTLTTELIRPLKGSIKNYNLYSLHPLSPKGMYRDLVKTKIVDRSVFREIKNPHEKGYIFTSRKKELQSMFEKLRRYMGRSKLLRSFDYYINKSNHKKRRDKFNALKFKKESERLYYLNFFNELEDFIFMKENYMKNFSKKEKARRRRHEASSNKSDYGIPLL